MNSKLLKSSNRSSQGHHFWSTVLFQSRSANRNPNLCFTQRPRKLPNARRPTRPVCLTSPYWNWETPQPDRERDLSVTVGLTRLHTCTCGRNVPVYCNHKPHAAVPKLPVGENPIRLQKMLCRIWHDFNYIKGKDLLIANDLSRSRTTNHTRSQSEEEIETIGMVFQDQSVTSHFK